MASDVVSLNAHSFIHVCGVRSLANQFFSSVILKKSVVSFEGTSVQNRQSNQQPIKQTAALLVLRNVLDSGVLRNNVFGHYLKYNNNIIINYTLRNQTSIFQTKYPVYFCNGTLYESDAFGYEKEHWILFNLWV